MIGTCLAAEVELDAPSQCRLVLAGERRREADLPHESAGIGLRDDEPDVLFLGRLPSVEPRPRGGVAGCRDDMRSLNG